MHVPSLTPTENMAPSIQVSEPSLGDASLTVLQYIANRNGLDDVSLFRHQVGINWRQTYSNNEKVEHLNQECFAHNDQKALETLRMSAINLGKLTVDQLVSQSNAHEVYSVGSLVYRGAEMFHIPMMNFHPEADDGLSFIMKSLRALRRTHPEDIPPGVLVASGRYYHYYGYDLLPEKVFSRYLSHFLMPSILVSPRYVGHALYEEQCSLRLTNDDTYKPHIPAVVARVD